jgi:hypothetical protein
MKITLTNEFHHTSVSLNLKGEYLSLRQLAKARKALCGNKECLCSGISGMRGRQAIPFDIQEATLKDYNDKYHLVPRFVAE